MITKVDEIQRLRREERICRSDRDKLYLGSKIRAIDQAMDERIYELYGLTQEEVEVLEASLPVED